MQKMTIYERVMGRLLREGESAFGKVSGLGAIVVDQGEMRRAYLYDTNMLIDYLRYGDEFVDKPIDMEPLSTRREAISTAVNRIIKGYIAVRDEENCHGASSVAFAVGPGYGKEIYGMGYALSKNGLLASDRGSVSGAARAAWKKVADSGRKRHKFDDRLKPKTPPIEDDCSTFVDAHKEHLNYAYEAEGWEKGMLKYLEAQHEATMQELSDIPNVRAEVTDLIRTVSSNQFWSRHYEG